MCSPWPQLLVSEFLSVKSGKSNTCNFRNDKSNVNTEHESSPTVTICSHFFLCCGYLSPVPSSLCSEFLGLITLAGHDSNPLEGPSMACLSFHTPNCNVMEIFGCLLCLDLIFTFRMLFSSIFFSTCPKFASTFYVWMYLSTFFSSFKTLVSHRFETTGLVIRLDKCNPKFFPSKTPVRFNWLQWETCLSRKGKIWPQQDYKFQFKTQ